MFISFEGIDGSGKSTQVELFKEYISAKKIDCIWLREPGITDVGEAIREILLHRKNSLNARAELLLFLAARAQITSEIIIPALNEGKLVIADRFRDSSVAYQGYGRTLGVELVETLNDFATLKTFPDITFLIDVSAEEAFNRRRKDAKNDRIEVENLEFFERVRNGYLEMSEKYPKRYYKLDGTMKAEYIKEEIVRIFEERFRE